jgi:hypothetical protein
MLLLLLLMMLLLLLVRTAAPSTLLEEGVARVGFVVESARQQFGSGKGGRLYTYGYVTGMPSLSLLASPTSTEEASQFALEKWDVLVRELRKELEVVAKRAQEVEDALVEAQLANVEATKRAKTAEAMVTMEDEAMERPWPTMQSSYRHETAMKFAYVSGWQVRQASFVSRQRSLLSLVISI